MIKDITEYTVEEILDEYSDVVEALKSGEYLQKDNAIANNIVTVILAGIHRDAHEDILEVIQRMKDGGRGYGKPNVTNYDLAIGITNEDLHSGKPKRYKYSTDTDTDLPYTDDSNGYGYDESWGPMEDKARMDKPSRITDGEEDVWHIETPARK